MAERKVVGAGIIEEKIEQVPKTEEQPSSKAEALEAEDDDELESVEDAEGPTYRQEELGPRVGDHALNVAEAKNVEELKEQLEGEDLQPLLFPVKVTLQDKGLMHHWAPGVHLVPLSLSKHWWLKHNKVRKAGPVQKAMAEA